MITSLTVVSAGLSRTGGGRAAAGRLLADGAARYARSHGLGFAILSLGGAEEPRLAPDTRHFAGSRWRLAAAALAAQRAPTALLFDLLGVARVQALLPSAWRAPYLIALYGIEVWRPLGWAHRRALRGAAVVASISEHTLARARPFTGALPQARVLPLALEDPPAEDPAATRGGAAPYFLIVGRMAASERYKGHDLVLDALALVARQRPEARLTVAGDGDDRRRLEGRARELGVADRTDFVGYVADAALPALYRGATAFVMPSTGEGFGLVFLEAMRAGIPCVAARGSVGEEVLRDGESGLLVSPTDARELADVLLRLLAEPDLRARIGGAGAARYTREYTRARFETNLDGLLDELVSDVRH